ncbi:hypothetical protein P3T36_002662 [Kitasatospora sp. MAP12-15]|uniref:hypothetical protein n=1 Tax=unclassified Kitasatospora TaxID=2633591 RepID=UPI002474855F|nr:hypothetical protein [Kitasatospora sp. MAP12-44]MDH6112945.1 hypothetical protein [Kitasatospora sp. MAP12-44]
MNEYDLYRQLNAEMREIAAHQRLVTEARAIRRSARQAERPQGVSGRSGALRRLATRATATRTTAPRTTAAACTEC